MDKLKLSSAYGLHLDKDDLVCNGTESDSTTAFLKGAILGYCQTHEPEEVAELFDDAFNYLPICESTDIVACITKKMLTACTNNF